jgi:hypothetical protein
VTARNLFVLGLDDDNRRLLELVLEPHERLHKLLGYDEVRGVERFPFDKLLETTRSRLDDFTGDVHAITSLLDFPATELVPVLAAEQGVPGPSLEAVLRCNHKYWSRLAQREAAPANVPPFAAFDPWDAEAFDTLGFDPPMWVKPVNAYRSHLGFRVVDRKEFEEACVAFREELPKLAEPLEEVLERAELPEEIARFGGNASLAEGLIGGRQCTLEGFVHAGDVVVYGVVDSVRSPNRSSFSRYQYPSSLPPDVCDRLADRNLQLAFGGDQLHPFPRSTQMDELVQASGVGQRPLLLRDDGRPIVESWRRELQMVLGDRSAVVA